MLTDEARALLPMLSDSFERIRGVLDQFEGGRQREVLPVAMAGFQGWLVKEIAAD